MEIKTIGQLLEYVETEEKARELINYINKQKEVLDKIKEWLEEQHQFIIEIPAYTKDISIEHKTMEICYENVLDKLNELLEEIE